jgi:AraC-like DNA-binding protein
MDLTAALHLPAALPLTALNGGLFISRGVGIHPRRVIDSHELIFVRQGTLSIREEHSDFEVAAGQTLLLRQGRMHEGTAPFADDLSFYWLHFLLGGGAPSGETPLAIPRWVRLPQPDRMVELFRRFLDDQQSGRGDPVCQALRILLMLAEIRGAQGECQGQAAGVILANQARQYIRTHFHEPLSCQMVARALRCNPDYLGRIYHAAHDETITQSIHRRRLRHAAMLLLESRLSINEIARQCGFPNPGYFRRLFIRYEGYPPSAYRRLYAQTHVNTV